MTKQDNYELEHFAGSAHVNTLYSTLSRHILRPNPYAAQDLNSQIQEHTAVTPRATRVLCLGTLIIDTNRGQQKSPNHYTKYTSLHYIRTH